MNQRGISLVESLIAVAIIGIAISAIAPAFFVQMDTNTRNEERTEAAAAAALVMERLRFEDPSKMPDEGSSDPRTITVGKREYEAVVHFCAIPEYCGPGSRHVRTEVSLDDNVLYTIESVYSSLQ